MKFLGISGFALLHSNFPINQFLEQYPDKPKNNPAVAVLLNYFGKKAENLKLFCDKFACKQSHLVELHLGFRDFTSAELVKMDKRCKAKIASKVKEAKRVIKVAGNDKTVFIICPILEDTVTVKSWAALAKEVRKTIKLPLVRSTLNASSTGGKFEERHGANPKFTRPIGRCIANPDGVSMNYGGKEKYDKQISESQAIAYRKKYNRCFAVFSWSADQQGLGGTANYNKPPVSKRKYVVTAAAIKFHRQQWFK